MSKTCCNLKQYDGQKTWMFGWTEMHWLLQACLLALISGQSLAQSPRVLKDPCLGQYWRLTVDSSHPGGPGQLTQVPTGQSEITMAYRSPVSASGPEFVIRTGDRITVEQQSPVLHARLVAIALQSAVPGQLLRVRLHVGGDSQMSANGATIQVRALETGHALWLVGERGAL